MYSSDLFVCKQDYTIAQPIFTKSMERWRTTHERNHSIILGFGSG